MLWAFGRGRAGQTYVFERDGAFYESRVSFYQALDGLDLTMGAVGEAAISSIDDAAGRRMDSIGGARLLRVPLHGRRDAGPACTWKL